MGMITFRRYRAAKARAALELGHAATAMTHVAASQAAPGTPLPDDFPARAQLAAATVPYTTIEDLHGATEAELTKVKGIGVRTARAILTALEALEA